MYRLLRFVSNLIFKLFFQLKVEGREHIPKSNPFIMVANHDSLLDGFILASIVKRPIAFLSAAFLFKKPFVGWFLKRTGAIPVQKRGQNLDSLKRAIKVLAGGGVIGIFPEGGIYESDLLLGAGYLAAKSGASLLPASIIGADKALPAGQRWPRFVKIRVIIGERITVKRSLRPSRKLLEETTEILRTRIDGLRAKGMGQDGRG